MNGTNSDTLRTLSYILHWLGKYNESNLCARLAAFLDVSNIQTAEELEAAISSAAEGRER